MHRKKKRKVVRIGTLKKKVWKKFSILVRYGSRDSLGRCKCVTCGVKKPWKEMQAGHFISRRYSAVYFDFRNVHPQCETCNVWRYGEQYLYGEWMKNKYGQATVDELWSSAREGKQFTAAELQSMLLEFEAELVAIGFEE